MKTIEIKLYQFNELSEEAQEKAINDNWDFYVGDGEWWETVYEDARQIGLQITGFDLDRRDIAGDFIQGARECAEAIRTNHGESCETYQTATQFLKDYDELVERYSDGVNKNAVAEENEYEFDSEAGDLESEFLQSLLADYLTMLRKEYEYQTSPEAIKEALISNEYDFTADGEMYTLPKSRMRLA